MLTIRQKPTLSVLKFVQIRSGRKPDGVCLVVGSCARGFKDNSTSDVIYSSSSVKKVGDSEVQLFWEVFYIFVYPSYQLMTFYSDNQGS